MGDSPSIIFKGSFNAGQRKGNNNRNANLEKFVSYMTRKSALKKNEEKNKLSEDELKEMQRIEKGIASFSELEGESVVKDVVEMEKYINYMSRKNALLEKRDSESDDFLHGAFSSFKRNVTKNDVSVIKDLVVEAQKNKSVMYQDIISFTDDFLIEEGHYDPKTDFLDEEALYTAVGNMTDTLIEHENLENAFWFATIHRNTDNIHVHVSTMEKYNTRKIIEYDGNEEARGTRKETTLEKMKESVGRSLLNSREELVRISDLRQSVPKEFSGSLKKGLLNVYINDSENRKENGIYQKYMNEIIRDLPKNTKGYQGLDDKLKNKIDIVTEHLTKDSLGKKEYLSNAKTMNDLYQKTYGEGKKSNSFYDERVAVLNSRLGNSLIRELKDVKKHKVDLPKYTNNSNVVTGKNFLNNLKFKTKEGQERYEKMKADFEKNKNDREKDFNKKIKKSLNRKDFNTIKRNIIGSDKMYTAEQEYEKVQKQIEQKQRLRGEGYEM